MEDQLGYDLDRGEPPGRWMGRGAEHLGLTGEVDEHVFLDLTAGMDPGRGELLGTRHNERTVRGYDVTCSAPKSVSVLWAVGDDAVREQVLAGHDAAVAGVVDWIDRHAHCRYRVAGDVRVFDATRQATRRCGTPSRGWTGPSGGARRLSRHIVRSGCRCESQPTRMMIPSERGAM